jgi:hypothetical protein
MARESSLTFAKAIRSSELCWIAARDAAYLFGNNHLVRIGRSLVYGVKTKA